ncbi:hypothetical protein Q9L58_009757 [Maublancomyces gigas]|uniref:Uncharacterized protein n=1 Tax=Discina gigas TaxID=1032678 RepID=A0ABR3G633_9PEZI
MIIQAHKTIHLSMEFFPPPTGNVSVKQGFLAEIPEPITEPRGDSVKPTAIRCIFSESTSHSMAAESILEKISGKFLWLDGTIKANVYNPNATETYFFTSALGDACQEDRQKGDIITPQLEVLGALSLYFRVNNDDGEGRARARTQYQFLLPHILVVKELFPDQPSLTAASAAKFELCLGQDFFQAYPHLLFEFTPSPACDILISSIHVNRRSTVFVDVEGYLHIYAAGICVAVQEHGQADAIVQGGFGIYFTHNSVYNTCHHLPALGSGVKDLEFRKDGLASGFGNAPPKDAPSQERADLASLVLAMEMAISLHRIGHSFKGVTVYHYCTHFNMTQNEGRTRAVGAGLMKPNNDLIHRLFLLQDMIESPRGCALHKVRFLKADDKMIKPALRLAELGAKMWAFTGSMTFVERCLSTGCEHPIDVHASQISSPSGLSDPASPSTSNIKFDFSSVGGETSRHAYQRPESSQSSPPNVSGSITVGRSRRSSLSRQSSLKLKGKLVSRVPMFLNYGSTITYVSQGKLVAFTPRGLFLLDKETATAGLNNLESDLEGALDGATGDCWNSGKGDPNVNLDGYQPGREFSEMGKSVGDTGLPSKKCAKKVPGGNGEMTGMWDIGLINTLSEDEYIAAPGLKGLYKPFQL